MYSQTFTACWPDVLHEMLEYVRLTQVAVSQGRRARIQVAFSRHMLRPDQLQPHVQDFLKLLERLDGIEVEVRATEASAHRLDIDYGA